MNDTQRAALSALRDFIPEIDRNHFDMKYFYFDERWIDRRPVGELDRCGTTACYLGWGMKLPAIRNLGFFWTRDLRAQRTAWLVIEGGNKLLLTASECSRAFGISAFAVDLLFFTRIVDMTRLHDTLRSRTDLVLDEPYLSDEILIRINARERGQGDTYKALDITSYSDVGDSEQYRDDSNGET